MILLDTNVISELMKPEPNSQVLTWADRQLAADLFFSAISKAEVEWGIELLPGGKRKRQLLEAADAVFALFEARCVDYRCDVTPHYVSVATQSRQAGSPMSVEDMLIAAIALANGAVLATRNVTDFSCLPDLTLVNPWQCGNADLSSD